MKLQYTISEEAQACSPLIPLCRELLRILDIKEESDSGRSFHPTTIQSCCTMDLEKLRDTLSGIRDYLENAIGQPLATSGKATTHHQPLK